MKKVFFLVIIISIAETIFFLSCKKEYSCEGCIDTTVNKPPIANAGKDTTIILPVNSIILDGSGSTDPDNNITGYAWTKISGPSSFNINKASAVQTQVINLVEGVYLFELKVTDAGGLFSKDTVQIIVNAEVAIADCNGNIRPQVITQLIQVGNLSQPKNIVGVASAGNKIFFAGGFTQNGVITSRVDIFDIGTNMWSTAELSQAREGITIVALGNKVFFAGGGYSAVNNYINSSRVDIYDVVSNTWSTAELSVGRQRIAAASAGNKVVFTGGFQWDAIFYASPTVDIYDASANTWSQEYLSNRSVSAGAGIATAVLGDEIYFAGSSDDFPGYDFGDLTSTINIYNTATNTWSVSNLNTARGFAAGIGVNNKIYWVGGDRYPDIRTPNTYTNEVEMWDKNTGTSTFCSLFQINAYLSAVQKGNKIVFFTGDGVYNNKFDIYDITNNRWSIGVLPVNIQWASIISVNNTIYVAGGIVNGVYSNQVWKLEF